MCSLILGFLLLFGVQISHSKIVKDPFIHAIVKITAVGNGHYIGHMLLIKHRCKALTFQAMGTAAGLDHTSPSHHLLIVDGTLQQVIQKMVKGIPFLIPLHAQIVAVTHLRQIVVDQTQGQASGYILPLVVEPFLKRRPKDQTHQKDVMTHGTGRSTRAH